MAALPSITRFSATKDLRAGTLPLLDTFRDLLDTVEDALRLDLDLAPAWSWDPATSGFAEAAEARWQDCLTLASNILDAEPKGVDERGVQRMCLLFHFLIETQNSADAERFQMLMYQNVALFAAEDPDICRALTQATRLVDAIVEAATHADETSLTLR
ncbi:hypothetical protein [Pseudophaeobacter profundi]|uniref:hypothetical protein n=1 Tax=Pseudophaeobacter profundi TaxID=3034152 RepID=UPI00243331BE|nr:hypothetical protein [Pseudophaeobacter profundi]